MKHHSAGLARLTRRSHSPEFIERLLQDYTTAELQPRERAMLDYVHKLTITPWEMVESDLDPMREAGLSDSEILDANIAAGYYAYANRLAQGLGIELEAYHLE